MRRNRIWLITACIASILIVSVFGTLAYLTDTTGPVVNTFVMGKLLDDPLNFILKEHQAKYENYDGVYVLDLNTEVNKNDYTVLPGVDLPKDPFVKTEETLKLDAYVFIEVVDQTGTALSFTVDSTNWLLLGTEEKPKIGPHDGKVYVMAADNGIAESGAVLGPINILKDNKITVANVPIDGDGSAQFDGTVTFYGYMIQAGGFADYNAAWAGFVNSASST